MHTNKNCIFVAEYISTLHRPVNAIAVLHCIDLGAKATPGTSHPVDNHLLSNMTRNIYFFNLYNSFIFLNGTIVGGRSDKIEFYVHF